VAMVRGMTDEWLTRAQAAERLGVHTRTFDRWCQLGRVPVHRTPGGRPRFRRDQVDALLQLDPDRPGTAPARL